MSYYNRVCAIDVSPDIRVTDLKIKFEIKKSLTADKNYCRVDIYNLSEATRNRITNDINSLVRVQAGYLENVGLVEIGQGNISNVIHSFKTPDIITTIYAKDGFRATRRNNISLSFVEKTPLDSIIKAIIGKLDLPVKFVDYDKSALLNGGFSHIGSIPDALNQLALQFNFSWSIQNGQVLITGLNKSTGRQTVVLSASTGLIENPEKIIKTKELALTSRYEYKVTSLLQPQLEISDLIKIESKTLNGVFIINEFQHIGDTRGNDWYTNMIVAKN